MNTVIKKRRRQLILLTCIILAAVITLFMYFQRTKPTPVEIHKVDYGPIRSKVASPGKIRPVTEVQISSDVPGRVVSLPVTEGQQVKKGQLLVQIDPLSYKAQVNQSKANLAQARASLYQSEAQWKRTQQLFKRQLISRQEMETAQAQYRLDRARVDQAKAALDQAIDELGNTTILAPIAGTITNLIIESGEIVVTGTMNMQGTVLMVIADLSEMRAECEVDEADIASIRNGQHAEIEVDAFPDTLFSGTVEEIGYAPESQTQSDQPGTQSGSMSGGQANTDPSVNYIVKVEINDYKGNLKPEMSANVDIITDSKEKALIVSILALVPEGTVPQNDTNHQNQTDTSYNSNRTQEYSMFIMSSSKARNRSVKTGIFGDNDVEILKGVNKGDTVITGPFSTLRDLKDGQRVKPFENGKGKQDDKESK